MYPSFKALHGRQPEAGRDFDPDKDLCEDDHNYFAGVYPYSDEVKAYPMEIIENTTYKPQQIITTGEPMFIISSDTASYGWKYAVQIKNKKLVVFPKFLTLAIGFEGGEWDLPYDCTVDEIWRMIKSDRGHKIKKQECLAAIRMLKERVEADVLAEAEYTSAFKRASDAWSDYNNGG